MNKIFSLKIVPVVHRHSESDSISLVTTRHYLVVWFLGLRISLNMGFYAHN